ncbi:translation initiation inhibitor YjgF [Acetobacter fabarum]|nr:MULTISPECIES: translation initiation inhibitor YjgF [Acetobacter]MCH4025717.1 translation initiation inhibitor YjgF [Acetobacter fabarum]MCH4054630.1 translation initiation inhibitor YjgF [Acetobacter fabarum]MCH4086423.1 translation initiation inhibitor YjgF [Acetobacter fabarum]MCH4128529.1 translation initiation inhibitor YjgF [Acetobacter fabarum]MCH4138298.1 translation initiation inhibitor YjgF [Acetobacter fabarum]
MMKDKTLTRTPRSVASRPRVVQTAGGFELAGLHAPQFRGVDLADQCRAAFEEAVTLLEPHDLTLRDVSRIVCHIADADEFPASFPVFRQFFPTTSPGMTMMWLKDAPSSVPKITVDLIINVPEEEDMDVAAGF